MNGHLKQDGNTKNMIFGVAELIAEASSKWTLEAGDFLLTGTPEVSSSRPSMISNHHQGVGSAREGDVLRGEIPNLVSFEFVVAPGPTL